jgi:hypothetical protein
MREWILFWEERWSQKARTLGRGSCILINSQNQTFYQCLREELLNEELSDGVFEGDRTVINEENVFERLSRAIRFDFNALKHIEFIASHFDELQTFDLNKLDFSTWVSILTSPAMKIESEDAIFENISELIERDRSFFALLEFVQFEFGWPERLDISLTSRLIFSTC